MLEGLKEAGPVVVVDAGDLFYKRAVLPAADREQVEIKAELQARALALSGLDALVPGEGDLALGVDRLLGLASRFDLPLLAANLVCGEHRFEGHRVVERGGRRIGLIGVAGVTTGACTAADPVAAVASELGSMGPLDVVVAIVHGDAITDERIATEVPGVDFVINGHVHVSRPTPRQLRDGAWELGAGSRGKRLGVLELEWIPGAVGWRGEGVGAELAGRLDRYRRRLEEARSALDRAADDAARKRARRRVDFYRREVGRLEKDLAGATGGAGGRRNRFRNRLVDLDPSVGEHAATQALVEAAEERIDALAGGQEAPPLAAGPFVGSQACGVCHAAQRDQWAGTAHAGAWRSLADQGRSGDRDCFACHVTGAFQAGGPGSPGAVPDALRGVGCEACHGPGRTHARSPGIVHLDARPGVATCRNCHDGSRDEGRFDEASYMERIRH